MNRDGATPHNIWELYEDRESTRQGTEAKAKMMGCTVEWARPHEVQIDIDSPEAEALFNERWAWFQETMTQDGTCTGKPFPAVACQAIDKRVSRGGNCHVTIFLGFDRMLQVTERLLIACLLGSDLKREMLNYTRYKLHGDDQSCLFRPLPLQLGDGNGGPGRRGDGPEARQAGVQEVPGGEGGAAASDAAVDLIPAADGVSGPQLEPLGDGVGEGPMAGTARG